MKIVLRKDVDNLGEVDAVIKVADGYARNFLLPRGLAVLATKAAVAGAEKRQAEKESQLEARRAEFEDLAGKISASEITIQADAGEEGKLFGSVTAQDIVTAVKDQAGLDVEKKKVDLAEHIKVLGDYEVPVKLYKEIIGKLKVKVTAKPKE